MRCAQECTMNSTQNKTRQVQGNQPNQLQPGLCRRAHSVMLHCLLILLSQTDRCARAAADTPDHLKLLQAHAHLCCVRAGLHTRMAFAACH